MNVAGADLSITKSGVALADGRLLTIRSSQDGYHRLRPMAAAVLRLLAPHDLVIIEGYDPHPRGYLALVRAAELGGMVRAGLVELNVPFLDVPPSTLKKFACGKGNAPKPDIIEAARAAGANPTSDDEADAFWLRQLGRTLTRSLDGLQAVPDELHKLAEAVRPLVARTN